MRRRILALAGMSATAAIAIVAAATSVGDPPVQVRMTRDEARQQVDVLVDGKPFTSFIHRPSLRKPVLFPLRTAGGNAVTRGFPLEPRPGERVDHPHQVGLWFNYGDVGGFDFWNNSDAIGAADRPKMGTIVHEEMGALREGEGEGELEARMKWVGSDGKALLAEHARFVFRGGPGWRSVDRIARLRPLAGRVAMPDNKEGMLGLRVARALEMPSNQPETFTDAAGRPTSLKVLDNAGVTGRYFTSEGKTGEAVWGTRARWCALSGRLGDEVVTVAILDHPLNPGFPTYWHARGYGLFAANPLGQNALSGGRETLGFAIEANDTATFRYRILILSEAATKERLEAEYKEFASAYR
ncbi:MAG TPA: PmoA family protein [Vicinamibacterales bacterium]|nr:PmoA family protein [Vicinamibacterales bacterium]